MKDYMNYCLIGKSSIPERKEMLFQKRNELLIKLKRIEDSIEYIDKKQQFYDDVLDNKITYFSYLNTNI